jgi:UDP-N-acetylmuramoyl-L-alanyl-D-glutamate--2,6-diaminopimelate ligase
MILNRDDGSYDIFASTSKDSLSYGLHPESDWRITNVVPGTTGFSFDLTGPLGHGSAHLPMLGDYNVLNAVAALAAAVEVGVPLPVALNHLETFGGVPGRMQLLQTKPFAVVVDFAHTVPAIEKVLNAFRPRTRGKLIVVIGAAGERDPAKRGPLGRAAARNADLVLFTEEDSRSESIEVILATLAGGAKSVGALPGTGFRLEPDRRKAIEAAIAEARPGDTVILCGKGHEQTLERAGETLDWDEESEARQHL